MKPLLHPSCFIILFLSMSLLILSPNIPTCLCEDDSRYTDCNTAFSCEGSSISNDLKYPFWGGNRKPYCGTGVSNPNMELKCEGSVPEITINQVKHRILGWDNTTQRLKVARDDYGGGDICDVSDYKNSTFEHSPFQRDGDQILNLTLLYNCDANPTTMLYRVACGTISIVYTVLDPSSVNCSPTVIVVIPLLGQQAASLVTGSGINDALKEGFELKWTGDYRKCQTCVDSGGVCGNDGETGFTCFCKDGSHTTTCNSEKASSSSQKRNRLLIVIGALVGGSGVMIFFIIMISCHLKRERGGENRIIRKQRKFVDHNVKAFMQSYHSLVPKQYNYAELKRITKSFQSKLGQGGYGVVYKASLPDGRHVAVKVISESKGNGEEFINEVASISKTSHVNIVSLMGFCYQANKRALVYEFMPNGSLDKFIYRSDFPCAICDFDWNTLFRIVIGIARGLEYLHQGCISRILHLDIKPQNILLDEDFCPKISDFGLAKICQKKESIVSIPGTRGTIGYMAPEVFSRAFGGVSHKSDVYSYGMLILEIIGGRKNHDTGGSHTSEMYFPDWVYKDLEQGNSLINWLAISKEENDMLKKITMVSLWCIQTNPSNRPSMKRVIEMLEGPLQLVPYPPKPVLYSPERPPLQISYMSSSNLYQTNSISLEKNGSIEPNEFNKDESEM